MGIIEGQFKNGTTIKTACDLCNEEPENGVLIEKPNSMIVNGKVYKYRRPNPLHVCLDCLTFEVENIE